LNIQLAGTTASIDRMTCDPPSPNTSRFIARSLARLNSSPIENIRKTTPNSARYLVWPESLARPSACGPIRMPTARYPSIGGSCNMRNATTPKRQRPAAPGSVPAENASAIEKYQPGTRAVPAFAPCRRNTASAAVVKAAKGGKPGQTPSHRWYTPTP
jgi:hypothetical protein